MADYRLSIVAAFDDLCRNSSILSAGIESEFLSHVKNAEDNRKKWLAAETELHTYHQDKRRLEGEINALETKLKHARGQIDHEMKRRMKAEADRDTMSRQLDLIRELLMNDKNNKSMLTDADREKLTFLNRSFQHKEHRSPRRSAVNETGSLLSPSDISYDKTEDDLDEISYLRTGKRWKRPSAPPLEEEEELTPPHKKTRAGMTVDGKKNTSIVATTTVTVDRQGGPMMAESEIRAVPNNKTSPNKHKRRSSKRRQQQQQESFETTAGTIYSYYGSPSVVTDQTDLHRDNTTTTSPCTTTYNTFLPSYTTPSIGQGTQHHHCRFPIALGGPGIRVAPSPPLTPPPSGLHHHQQWRHPLVLQHERWPILDEDTDSGPNYNCQTNNHNNNRAQSSQQLKGILKDSNTPSTPTDIESPGLRHFNSAGKGLNRQHTFVSKTVIRPETCIPCGKRVKFGKVAMKCKDCKATCHPDCKEQVPLPCVPSNTTPGTAKTSGGYIADYTPLEAPMIPAIVVHCVNEIETRGMSEVGIYRVPGADRSVKDLKERFLRGKGTPNLSAIDDIHVLCGCVKDFLRGLKEPLCTFTQWRDFVQSSELQDHDEKFSSLYQAITQLPQPNRDTLAFIILHLQRVSESEECKMPLTNLAKVFGPTIVGYSTPEPEPMQMISETRKQAQVMESLIQIPTEYWSHFLNVDLDSMYPLESMTPQTPDGRPPLNSMLGPITTPGRNEHKNIGSTQMTPRYGSKSKHPNKKPTHFFSSPMLK